MPTREFEFTSEHTHAGRDYRDGDRLHLPEAKAIRLRDQGAGRLVETQHDEPAPPARPPRKRNKRRSSK